MHNKYLTVVAMIRARTGMERALKEALTALIEPTRKEVGCLRYDLHVSESDPAQFFFYEHWTSHETLARHAESRHIRQFKARAEELLAKPTEITCWESIP